MFEDFIRQHIDDLIECSSDEYDINEEMKEAIVQSVTYDEEIWDIIDSRIYRELDEYIVEDEEEEE